MANLKSDIYLDGNYFFVEWKQDNTDIHIISIVPLTISGNQITARDLLERIMYRGFQIFETFKNKHDGRKTTTTPKNKRTGS